VKKERQYRIEKRDDKNSEWQSKLNGNTEWQFSPDKAGVE